MSRSSSFRFVFLPSLLAVLFELGRCDACGQTQAPVRMPPPERPASRARIGAELQEDWRRMIDLLGVKPPGSLPPYAQEQFESMAGSRNR